MAHYTGLLGIASVDMSKQRVAERVAHGGHGIPIKAIERRFARSINNLLYSYSDKVDTCLCFMNSSEQAELIFEQKGRARSVANETYYQLLLEEAGNA